MNDTQLVKTEPNAAVERRVSAVVPRVDIYESPDGYLVLADLPGVTRDTLEITLEGGELSIAGRRSVADADLEYRRSFHVPQGVDREGVTAQLEGGVLRLALPRAAADKPRKIALSTSN